MLVLIHQPLKQPRLTHVRRGREAERVGNKGQAGALAFVLGNQAQQNPLLEGRPQVQIAHHRIVLLPKAVNPPIALLQPVRVERQLQMDEVMTALVQIEPLSRRVGTHQHQPIGAAKALRHFAACRRPILAAHQQHRAAARLHDRTGNRLLAIGVLGVDQHICRWLSGANGLHLRHQLVKLRIGNKRRRRQIDQRLKLLDHTGLLRLTTRTGAHLTVKRHQLLRQILRLQHALLVLLLRTDRPEAVKAALILAQRPQTLTAAILTFRTLGQNALEAARHHVKRLFTRRYRRDAALEQGQIGQHIAKLTDAEGSAQFGGNQRH